MKRCKKSSHGRISQNLPYVLLDLCRDDAVSAFEKTVKIIKNTSLKETKNSKHKINFQIDFILLMLSKK